MWGKIRNFLASEVHDQEELKLVATDEEMKKRLHVLAEVAEERKYQDTRWGGADHDDVHENEESWLRYITEYATAQDRAREYNFRKRMVKVAALAVAAIESWDRKRAV